MESSLSSSSLAPVFSSQSWKYDVFLSFRGKDTRKNFVDHLYSYLVQKGINTYKDDESLGLGDLIVPSLTKAIENSQIAIIVFSEGYADSAWCLNELAHIMKCKETRGQLVMPIFYNVDPSQMRKQKRKYAVTFSNDDDSENKDKVESWRRALVDACSLSGWVPKSGHESQVIEEVVEKISLKLQLATSSATEKLVGMATRVHALIAALQIESGGVRMIGVCGVGGVGKTTLASCVYDEISSKFDGCCFVRNIGEESRRRGLEELKKEIISKVEAQSGGGGRRLINRMFCYMKVMFVLDDVDNLDQLKALAGSPHWFGAGSRIIITSRHKHLLEAHKVLVHDISVLDEDEAVGLFRKHAHQDYNYRQMEDIVSLSKEVVSYAGRLPLALTALGSFLRDKKIQQWNSALDRLKPISNAHILEKLKISFDGLTMVQKDLFLDIACFFRWWKKDRAMEVLDACGFDAVRGLEELGQKALIRIDSFGRIDMHDLVQEMGHNIVRGKHPNNPEKHTRVWKEEDILRICAMDASTELDNIEAIQVEAFFFQEKDPPPIVANMKNLRYISWRGDPTNPSLDNFPPRGLRCLILHGGSQKQLWNRYKYLPNLKMMELKNLKNLTMTPSFDGLPSLERLMVYECPNLKEIHSSLGRLEGLVCLRIEDCPRITMAPSITRLNKLESLSIKGCPKSFELSDIQQLMYNLRELDLSRCHLEDNEDMSSALLQLHKLRVLNVEENKLLRLDFSLLQFPWLKRLNLSGCNSLVELPELPSSIAVVIADGCTSLETVGDISNCKWLWRVSLRGVYKVGPLDGYMLLHSMLKGNAFEDHHISVSLQHQIPKRFVGRLFRGNAFTMRLPHDCYSNFCGFLIHVVSDNVHPIIDINIKDEVFEDPPFEPEQESSFEALEPEYDGPTYVGYVSFSWLKRTACFNSTYNAISFNLHRKNLYSAADRLGAALVPRGRKYDPMQTTDCSEVRDEEGHYKKAFTIQNASDSSINILWQP